MFYGNLSDEQNLCDFGERKGVFLFTAHLFQALKRANLRGCLHVPSDFV